MTFPPPTARLFFRTWGLEDWPLAMALWGDPRVSALIGGPFNENSVRERLETELHRQELHGIQYWPLFRNLTARTRRSRLARGLFRQYIQVADVCV